VSRERVIQTLPLNPKASPVKKRSSRANTGLISHLNKTSHTTAL
jgi:hypothetical protein